MQGCQPGTEARKPLRYAALPFKVSRCPVAILRDQHPMDEAWVSSAERWAYAKSEGAAGFYPAHPSRIARDLTEVAQEELAAIKAEAMERAAKGRGR